MVALLLESRAHRKFGEEDPDVLGDIESIARDVFKGLLAGLSSVIPTN